MRNLFLKGLPREFWEDDLRALCAALDTTATSCLVWKDKKSKSRGVALVEVEDEQQAAALAQSLRQRSVRPPPMAPGGVAIGEGEPKWWLCCVEEGDETALIVEEAFREANYVRPDGEHRRPPKEKEDPRAKQQRLEVLLKQRRQAKREELASGVDPEERDRLLTLEKVRRTQAKFVGGAEAGQHPRCWGCWLLHPQCICTPETPPEILSNFRHRTIVWLHPKEFGRLSNTGGLISVAFPPPQSHVLVAGIKEDEDRMQAELERDPEATFVLFPSDDALTAEEFMQSLRQDAAHVHAGEAGSGTEDTAARDQTDLTAQDSSCQDFKRVYTIILVDGTWQQARRLALKIPSHIKRVKLMPREAIDPLYKSPMRSQATPDRVCSLSAYVLLLKELNTPPAVCDYLFQLLHRKSEIVLSTSGKQWKQTDGAHLTPKMKPPRNRRKAEMGAAGSGVVVGENAEVDQVERGDVDTEVVGVGTLSLSQA